MPGRHGTLIYAVLHFDTRVFGHSKVHEFGVSTTSLTVTSVTFILPVEVTSTFGLGFTIHFTLFNILSADLSHRLSGVISNDAFIVCNASSTTALSEGPIGASPARPDRIMSRLSAEVKDPISQIFVRAVQLSIQVPTSIVAFVCAAIASSISACVTVRLSLIDFLKSSRVFWIAFILSASLSHPFLICAGVGEDG